MNEHPAFLVFQHLGRFLESRGLVPAEGSDLDTPRERFVTALDRIGYYRLDATPRPDGRGAAYKIVTVILVLPPGGKYTDHGPHLRGLIASLHSENFAREGRLAEVIVVAPEEIMKKKNMTDVVKGFRDAPEENTQKKKNRKGSFQPPAVGYNMYPYHVFSLDIPQAQCVPRHTIVPAAEAKAFLTRERVSPRDLPQVASSDPPVVWIGARPGQIVRIEYASATAGKAYNYCYVSRA